ncbi:hypothetical protein pkur_cds_729 [Pandoravirus kuranda]|uniref:Ankyrin repeat domain containing protein n=1 Tax=Pandoravirus kuranda TaxID=3019033 RepID=A0AA95EF82_9VIRU|nr:hypothetical protein pkur_cds_729 [Pandoravirus kuranda]
MTTFSKRSWGVCLDGNHDSDSDAALCASPKRMRHAQSHTFGQGRDCDDGSHRDHLVASALVASDDDLRAALAQAPAADIESAILWLLCNVSALGRLCCALVAPTGEQTTFSPGSLVYAAARRGHPTAARMLLGLCDERDIGSALSAAINCGDAPALKVMIEACADDDVLPVDTYRRLVCEAMIEAVDAGSATIVAYLASACDDATLTEALDRACADHNDANDIGVFAVLWENAGLCAHAYAATLDPCPALDYLDARIARGESCAGPCLARVNDDGDSVGNCHYPFADSASCDNSWP